MIRMAAVTRPEAVLMVAVEIVLTVAVASVVAVAVVVMDGGGDRDRGYCKGGGDRDRGVCKGGRGDGEGVRGSGAGIRSTEEGWFFSCSTDLVASGDDDGGGKSGDRRNGKTKGNAGEERKFSR